MRAPRLALAAALLACAAPVAQAKPKHDKPEVVTRTYVVTTTLSGTYHGESHYDDVTTTGFCPGTGSVIDASFHVVANAKLRVKLDTNTSAHATLLVNDAADNDFSGDLSTTTLEQDDCSNLMNKHCTGTTHVLTGLQSSDFAYAQGAGHKMVFGTELTGPPGIDPNYTCVDPQAYAPDIITNGVGAATQPYISASSVFSLTKLNDLAVGQQRKRTFNPLPGRTPEDYDVATCNHADSCTGALNDFVHTIAVKRVK